LTTETQRGASSHTTRATVAEDVKPPNRPVKKKKQMDTSNSESKHEIVQPVNEDDDVDLPTPAFPTIPTNMEGMTECIICTDPFHPSDALVSICGDRRHIVHFACWKTNVRLNRKIGRQCFCRQPSAPIPVELYWNNGTSHTSIENETVATKCDEQHQQTIEPHLKWTLNIPPEDKSGDIIKTLRRCQQKMPLQFNGWFQQLSYQIQALVQSDTHKQGLKSQSIVVDIRRSGYTTEANVLRVRL
jgi:hypothetical protein